MEQYVAGKDSAELWHVVKKVVTAMKQGIIDPPVGK